MEREELELAITKLQAVMSVQQNLLIEVFRHSRDKRAIRDAFARSSHGLKDEMLFHDFGDDELKAEEEYANRILGMLDLEMGVDGEGKA